MDQRVDINNTPVTLHTANGDFVVSGKIPPFNQYPDVLFWGERVFVSTAPGKYKEAFCYVLRTSPTREGQ
ncbi:MAG: hypothetical protein F6K28_60945 [Microcoleus sp. SIO2G3]|nr:hypothetical protein [Microcoleus sp. SIO2G3]